MSLVVMKLWVTLKRFWYVPLVLLAIPLAYVLLGRSTGSGLLKVVKATADARREEIEALDKAAADERKAVAAAHAEHEAAVKREADEHQKRMDDVDAAKEARAAELEGRPVGELTDSLSRLIGGENRDGR